MVRSSSDATARSINLLHHDEQLAGDDHSVAGRGGDAEALSPVREHIAGRRTGKIVLSRKRHVTPRESLHKE